jgi:chromosome segregation ATPase
MRAVEALRIEVTKLQSEIKENRAEEIKLRAELTKLRHEVGEMKHNYHALKTLYETYGFCKPEIQVARMDAVEASQKLWTETQVAKI